MDRQVVKPDDTRENREGLVEQTIVLYLHNLIFTIMKVTLNLPENLNLKIFDISIYLATKLFEDGLLSSGQAAEMVGISKRAFIEILGKYGISVFSESMDDLKKDIGNA